MIRLWSVFDLPISHSCYWDTLIGIDFWIIAFSYIYSFIDTLKTWLFAWNYFRVSKGSCISRDQIIETEIDSNLDFSHTVITTRMIILFFANFILCLFIYHGLYRCPIVYAPSIIYNRLNFVGKGKSTFSNFPRNLP